MDRPWLDPRIVLLIVLMIEFAMSQFQPPYSAGVQQPQYPSQGFNSLSTQFPSTQQCPIQNQQAIRQCAQELRALGVFTQNQGEIDALTWDQIRRRSKQYFTQICEAYRRFDQCTQPYKPYCWYNEPIKGEFAVASEALVYVCGEGYYGMLNNWDCFLQASTRGDVISCESRIMTEARALQDATIFNGNKYPVGSDASCRVLQDYMGCIKQPIFAQCGAEGWRLVTEAVQRPTRVYLPYCTLSGSMKIPSSVITLISLIIVIILNIK